MKLPRYARAGTAEVWIVNPLGRTIERHTDPHESIYRQLRMFTDEETVESLVLPALSLSLAELLG